MNKPHYTLRKPLEEFFSLERKKNILVGMSLYPIFIDLHFARTIIVGAGQIGLRKLHGIYESGAREIVVLDPNISQETLCVISNLPALVFFARAFEENDLLGKTLVFAATDDPCENERIAVLCAAKGILCNRADHPSFGSFHVPAKATAGNLSVAFSTGGMSPALVKRIREETSEWLEERFGRLGTFMGRLRPHVLALGMETEGNSRLFRSLVSSQLGEILQNNEKAKAKALLEEMLPLPLQIVIEDLLDELC